MIYFNIFTPKNQYAKLKASWLCPFRYHSYAGLLLLVIVHCMDNVHCMDTVHCMDNMIVCELLHWTKKHNDRIVCDQNNSSYYLFVLR